ncbi:MAG: PDZ domain-containing protein [Opitutae bacterium]|nr:PDZ domain-containing protein [Opitutae bacterium]
MTLLRPVSLFLPVVALMRAAAPLPELFNERLKSAVAVEFFVQTETERQPVTVLGTVVDEKGTIILPGAAIGPGVAPGQLRDFKVYRPGGGDSAPAAYLGQDALTSWHFVRASGKMLADLVPVTRWPAIKSEPTLSDELWGIGLRNKDEDFQPYFLSSRVAVLMKLPQTTAILGSDVAGPGLPVFNAAGELAGIAQTSFGQNFLIFSRNQRGNPIVLVNVEESSVVLLAGEVLPYLGRIPQSATGRPIAWFGAYGLQPMDPEVAKLLKLENQSGVVVSDIMKSSPADLAGLQERDIVLAVDGQPLPHLKPDRVVVGYFGQELLRHRPGDKLSLSVLRGGKRIELSVTLGDEPKLVREAERTYFERLGFTAREFLYNDGIMHRAAPGSTEGAMVHFVKPGSAVATAGLRPDDWVREIDGVEIKTYAEAVAKLAAIESDKARAEFVLLVRRGGETQVLRVKLN